MKKPIRANPTRDLILAALNSHADLKIHPKEYREIDYISAFISSNGRALALDKTAESKQTIWVNHEEYFDDMLLHIKRDVYPPSRGRNADLHKLEGFKDGTLIRFFPIGVDQALQIVDVLLER
jgi:hypothetical protein